MVRIQLSWPITSGSVDTFTHGRLCCRRPFQNDYFLSCSRPWPHNIPFWTDCTKMWIQATERVLNFAMPQVPAFSPYFHSPHLGCDPTRRFKLLFPLPHRGLPRRQLPTSPSFALRSFNGPSHGFESRLLVLRGGLAEPRPSRRGQDPSFASSEGDPRGSTATLRRRRLSVKTKRAPKVTDSPRRSATRAWSPSKPVRMLHGSKARKTRRESAAPFKSG